MEIDIDISTIIGTRCSNIYRKKISRYGKYVDAISPHVEWLKNSITNAKDGVIRVKTTDIVKEMGREFARKNPKSIYWGLKYVLFHEGIVVDTGYYKTGDDDMLVMRLSKEDDKLPPSLAKYLDSDDKENQSSESSVDSTGKSAVSEKMFDVTKFNIDDIFINI